MDKKTYYGDEYACEGSGRNYKFFCAQDDNMGKADIDIDKDVGTIKTTYFSKSLKDKENTLLSNTLVKKLKKQKKKHVMVATRVEIGPLKNDAMQTIGNKRTSYMIRDTNIKSFNVQSSCAPESIRTGKSSIECDICSKKFISKYNLSSHYRTHTGEKPFECDICSQCFTQRSSLVSHYRTHTGEKPHECDICSRCFTLRTSLVKHYRTHTGEKPYECDICCRCLTQRSILVSHCRTHAGENPYKCDGISLLQKSRFYHAPINEDINVADSL